MAEIIWSPEAISNLKEIRERIEYDSPQNALNFTKELFEYPKFLLTFSETGKLIPNCPIENTKVIFYKKYRIAFRKKGADFEILAVHHGSKLYP